MLESLLEAESVRKSPWTMLLLSMVLGAGGIVVASIIGRGMETGHLVVAFTCIGAAPLMVRLVQLEEARDKEERDKGELGILYRHSGIIEAYGFYFIGFILISSLMFVVLPSEMMNQVFSSQVSELGAIGSMRSSTARAVSACGFACLMENNLGVLALELLFSFIFGVGALYVITWNASIVGVLIGTIARQQAAAAGNPVMLAYLVALPYSLIAIFPHGIFEIGAYFLGGLAGGMLSAALIRRDFRDKLIIKDIATITFLAVLCVVIGAAIESAAV